MKTKSPKVIGFRLEPEEFQKLCERAEAMNLSVHELARDYVLEILGKRPADPMGELREDLAVSVEALLSLAGKVPQAQAKSWVDHNLRS